MYAFSGYHVMHRKTQWQEKNKSLVTTMPQIEANNRVQLIYFVFLWFLCCHAPKTRTGYAKPSILLRSITTQRCSTTGAL
jgi:hypothetical protein